MPPRCARVLRPSGLYFVKNMLEPQNQRFLVTGALGCVGAWVVKRLLDEGIEPVVFDSGDGDHRLRLVLDEEQRSRLVRVRGDVTVLAELEQALDEHAITNVIHLAGLQVPSCRDNPPLGAAVNVVGTVNVFEAVKRRHGQIGNVAYASTAAVYGPGPRDATVAEDALERPATHYGVYKVANEGTARVYWESDSLPSIGLRPYVVYGPGRDQGVTSSPTFAMRAAAQGKDFHIAFGGSSQFHYAPDVAAAFIAASRSAYSGSLAANLPAPTVHMSEVIDAIVSVAPGVAITFDDVPLPFPEALQADALVHAIGPVQMTALLDGVAATVEHFRRHPDES
jgi:UDP-glucuronate 4-epimerase